MATLAAYATVILTVLSAGYWAFEKWVLPMVDAAVARDIARDIEEMSL